MIANASVIPSRQRPSRAVTDSEVELAARAGGSAEGGGDERGFAARMRLQPAVDDPRRQHFLQELPLARDRVRRGS